MGLGYGAGPVTFARVAKTQAGIDVTPDEAERIVRTWRDANRYVTEAWKRVEVGFRSALAGHACNVLGFGFSRGGERTVVVTLPNGYELYYQGAGVDGRELYWRPDGVTREKIYGGCLLWENLIQATAAQLLRRALVTLENKCVAVVLHVYDETVAEADDKKAAKVAKLIADTMREAPPWTRLSRGNWRPGAGFLQWVS